MARGSDSLLEGRVGQPGGFSQWQEDPGWLPEHGFGKYYVTCCPSETC